jgi:hypothetical protein
MRGYPGAAHPQEASRTSPVGDSGELASCPERGGSTMSQYGTLVSRSRGDEAVSLQARGSPHPGRDRYWAIACTGGDLAGRTGNTSDLETRPGSTTLFTRHGKVHDGTSTLRAAPKTCSRTPDARQPPPFQTPTTGRPCRVPSRLWRYVGDRTGGCRAEACSAGGHWPIGSSRPGKGDAIPHLLHTTLLTSFTAPHCC